MSESRASPIPVTVVTGFLGAGKTTLIRHWLRHPEVPPTAVIVNEFGDLGLDDVLLEEVGRDAVLLKNGCVCCSVRSDLALALNELALKQVAGQRGNFAHVLIETSGMADPIPVLQTLMSDPGLVGRYRLNGVVTLIDGVLGVDTLARHGEAMNQLAVADRVLITKSDLLAPAQLAAVQSAIHDINPGAQCTAISQGVVHPQDLLALSLYDSATQSFQLRRWLRVEAYGLAHATHHRASIKTLSNGASRESDERIDSYCITLHEPMAWSMLLDWLEIIARMGGSQLLRMKGVVNVREHAGRPVAIHGVQHLFSPPVLLPAWPDDDHRTRIVFITRGIAQEVLAGVLESLQDRGP